LRGFWPLSRFCAWFWCKGQIFEDPDLFGPDTLVLVFQGNDVIFNRLWGLTGGMQGFMGSVGETVVTVRFEPVDPFSDNGRAGMKSSGGWFDAPGESVLDHLVSPLFFIFRVSHDLVILVWAHAVIEPPLIG